MKLTLVRFARKETYTIGRLYVNGEYECDTIEDKVRDVSKEAKIYGETAIPYGNYEITMKVKSPKFSKVEKYRRCGGYLPRLLDVPYFEGILIHIGNKAEDSLGCILVGQNKVKGQVINSTETFWRLYEKMKAASDAGEGITIEITK